MTDVKFSDFEEEIKTDGMSAWRGYVARFQLSSHINFRHSKYQRMVTCSQCGVKVPKEIPRIKLIGSWSYYTGHYCLKCGSKILKDEIQSKKDMVIILNENIKNLEALEQASTKCRDKDIYKNTMSVAEMMAKLNPKKARYY